MPRAFHTAERVDFVGCRHTSHVYSPGSVLFSEGEQPRGVHILDSGGAKLFGSTTRGKIVVAKIAGSGEMLGLNAVILAKPYLVSAEVTEPSRVSFALRDDFLAFLRKSPEAMRRVVDQLSTNHYDSQRDMRTLNLSSNAAERLARLLLGWVEASEERAEEEVWIDMDLTHEQIAQMLDLSRETVSRAMSALARKGVIEVKGSALKVPRVSRLRALAKL